MSTRGKPVQPGVERIDPQKSVIGSAALLEFLAEFRDVESSRINVTACRLDPRGQSREEHTHEDQATGASLILSCPVGKRSRGIILAEQGLNCTASAVICCGVRSG